MLIWGWRSVIKKPSLNKELKEILRIVLNPFCYDLYFTLVSYVIDIAAVQKYIVCIDLFVAEFTKNYIFAYLAKKYCFILKYNGWIFFAFLQDCPTVWTPNYTYDTTFKPSLAPGTDLGKLEKEHIRKALGRWRQTFLSNLRQMLQVNV